MDPIVSNNPKTVTKTWPHWWLDRVTVFTNNRNSPQQTSSATCTFVRAIKKEDQTWEVSDASEDMRSVTVNDVFAYAAAQAQNGNLVPYQILSGFLSLMETIAREQNAID